MAQPIYLFEPDLGDAECEAVVGPIRSRWLTQGEITQRFEKVFSKRLGVQHSIACANGTAALHLAYHAVGISPGCEVIVPSLTFVATVSPLIHLGAIPVFADIENLTCLTLDPEDVERKITPKTKAIAVVHYAGVPASERLIELADSYQLYMIEDCAHALVSRWGLEYCGTRGTIGCFSFFSNKNMTTGEGGMLTVRDDELAERLRRLRSHGMTSLTLDRYKGHAFSYDVVEPGYNVRIDEIRSALGLAQLERLDALLEGRRSKRRTYIKHLQAIPNLTIPWPETHEDIGYHLMVVILPEKTDRESIMNAMREAGIQTSIHYPPVHTFSAYQQYSNTHLPVTMSAASRLLTLPFYPSMTDDDIDRVCSTLAQILSRA